MQPFKLMAAIKAQQPIVGYTPQVDRILVMLGLVDTPADAAFDKFTRLVVCSLHVPVSLVSIVDEGRDRQFFKSQIGLKGHVAEERSTPLSHSFCQFVKRDNRPLIIEHAPDDARVCDNLAVRDLSVKSYLGVPIHGPDGQALGALAAIHSERRHWQEGEVDLMIDLASCVTDQIKLRYSLIQMTIF